MAEILLTGKANKELARCYEFLVVAANQVIAKKAIDTIILQLQILKEYPNSGRPYRKRLNNKIYREKVIRFGQNGYLALYEYDEINDIIYIIGIRHGLEDKYGTGDS